MMFCKNNNRLPLMALTAVLIAFPVIVYFSVKSVGLSNLVWFFMALMVARIVFMVGQKQWFHYALIVLLLFLGGFLILADAEQVLFYYPAVMSGLMASLFLSSLFKEKTLIEKMAAMFVNKIPLIAKPYMRTLTKVWVLLLLLNGLVAAYSACCMSLDFWAFYNGFLSYVIFAVFMLAEFIFRKFYKKRHAGVIDNDF